MSEPYCPLEVGMKVVCVDAMCRGTDKGRHLEEGAVYVVRWVGPHIWASGPGIGVKLGGVIRNIHRDVDHPLYDIPFGALRFRPVRTIDTTKEVEALKQIVNDVFDWERVRA